MSKRPNELIDAGNNMGEQILYLIELARYWAPKDGMLRGQSGNDALEAWRAAVKKATLRRSVSRKARRGK